jgi:hypothetical protein
VETIQVIDHEDLTTVAHVLDLPAVEAEKPRRLSDLDHPVTAYLNGLAPSSLHPQFAALDGDEALFGKKAVLHRV